MLVGPDEAPEPASGQFGAVYKTKVGIFNGLRSNFFLTNGGIQVTTTGHAVCYAVEVDHTSNDGTFRLATPS